MVFLYPGMPIFCRSTKICDFLAKSVQKFSCQNIQKISVVAPRHIFPSRDLVLVRLGHCKCPTHTRLPQNVVPRILCLSVGIPVYIFHVLSSPERLGVSTLTHQGGNISSIIKEWWIKKSKMRLLRRYCLDVCLNVF